MISLLLGLALAQEAVPPPEPAPDALPAWAGKPVAFAVVAAPRGGLGEENLDALLRVRQDAPLRPMDVRQDLATLFRAGNYARVEAHVEPWPVLLPSGEEVEGVRVEYQVFPTPRIARIVMTGVRAVPGPELLGDVGIAQGNPWTTDDPGELARSLQAAYAARGWPAAQVSVDRSFGADGQVQLSVQVQEGAPQRIAEVRVRENEALKDAEVRAILARAGVRVGRPYTDKALREGQEALTRRLHTWRPRTIWGEQPWWPEARVNLKLAPAEEGGERLVVLIEPRRRWTIDLAERNHAAQMPSPRELVELMSLDSGARLGRDFAVEAGAALTDAARQAGWLDAELAVRVVDDDTAVRLTIVGDRGPRYVLRSVRARGDVIDPALLGSPTRGAYGCVTPRGGTTEDPKVAAARTRESRFLCQATAESARDVLLSPAFSRQTITPKAVDRAADEIEEFYRSQGYLGVKVNQVGFNADAEARRRRDVDVALEVTAGPRTALGEVLVEGAAPGLAEAVRFDDLLGEPLNPNTIRERARALVDQHQNAGYLHADARVLTELASDGGQARVRVVVEPGPVVLLRSVLITGHSRTQRQTIARQVSVAPGDPVSPEALAGVRRNLYELGVFGRVNVDPVGDEDRVKDLVVAVEEKKRLAFEAGGGLATDNGAALFARAQHRNLWGLAHRLSIYGQAGLGWVGDGWELDWVAPEWKVALRYEAPNLPTLGERVSVDVLLNESQQETAYRINRSGGGAAVRLVVSSRVTAELGYRAQYRQLVDVDPGVLVAGDAWLDELGITDLDDPVPSLPSAGRWASGIDASVVVDLRDDVSAPTKGGLGSIAVKVNDDVLSDIAFLRAEAGWTQLFPVGGFGLILRGRGGLALVPDTAQSLPVEDRFFAGGGGSFRGFDIDAVGPANYVGAEQVRWPDALGPAVEYSQIDAPGRWVSTGGDALAVATAEVDIPFPRFGLSGWDAWQLALFTDVGNVWWASPTVETHSMRQGADPLLRVGVGVGIRRSTPIGPLQLDLGINPSPLDGRDEEVLRLHFAVGAI